MKNSIKYLLLFLVVTAFAACQAHYKPVLKSQQGVNFKVTSLSEAKDIAKQQHKPLFVFIHATWCPTCKRMEHEVLVQKALGDIYNKDFINVAIDLDSPDGKNVNQLFPIRATPTLFFFNPDGSLAKKLEGFTTSADLLAVAQTFNTTMAANQ